ncbi:MAG TPA: bifunctional glutamate N-acetyltransferase/amino-acid acetyltransferase ArgJ [Nevskiaceae bacterium]|nr:bifunctional glutamate N-acetyltransferase/amino-acid acetyltransferase ArgJ [Nevskiaceae bacterium]
MAVNLSPPDHLLPVLGVRLGVAAAGVKHAGRDDLLVVAMAPGTRVAGVFTRNAFAAAPVLLCRERLARPAAEIRALIFNSGNANAATGEGGLADAREVTAALARALECGAEQVLPLSTGVIGERLPVARMTAALPQAVAGLGADRWLDGARAIMTTDTVPKGASRRVHLSNGVDVVVTGIAKGVGMICPQMGTTLSCIATDARLTHQAVEAALKAAVADSFNSITVDGDTSTNDSCLLCATAQTGSAEINVGDVDYPALAKAIAEVCLQLAQAMVRDGEGASRFIGIDVGGARSRAEARQVGYSIAHSPLVKTALFAGDPNWGRIIMAIGKAGVDGLDPAGVDVALDDVPLIQGGQPHPGYREELGAQVVGKAEYTIHVRLGRGTATAMLWTCDLGYDYVKINAEYRS